MISFENLTPPLSWRKKQLNTKRSPFLMKLRMNPIYHHLILMTSTIWIPLSMLRLFTPKVMVSLWQMLWSEIVLVMVHQLDVEIRDGEMKDVGYNILAEHLSPKWTRMATTSDYSEALVAIVAMTMLLTKKIRCESLEKERSRIKLFLDGPWKLNGVTAERHGLD
jgi:hypothetical protein